MARFEFGKNTIRGELVRLLIISLVIGIAVHLAFDYCGNLASDYYLKHSDYLAQHDRQYISSLQDYIDENRLDGTDQESLYAWTEENRDVLIQIYNQDYGIAFMSYNNDSKIYKTGVSTEFMDQMNEYTLHFSDGDYHAYLFGAYAYRPYNFCFAVAVASGVFAFLLVFLLGIRRKMKYIASLKEEVDILSAGDLDYEITVEGKDELAELAGHLDQMRVLLRHHMEEEARLAEENRSVISRLSHDIRTPLTTITLYSDLLLQKKYRDADQREHLIRKIHSSAEHMGKLAEQLSAHTMEQSAPKMQSAAADADVLQALPEMSEELRMQGYVVEESYQQEQKHILVNGEALARILDNILSNILRYADQDAPVEISAVQSEEGGVAVAFENRIRTASQEESEEYIPEGTGIGLQSIRTQMQKLDGSVQIENNDDQFLIKLYFTS